MTTSQVTNHTHITTNTIDTTHPFYSNLTFIQRHIERSRKSKINFKTVKTRWQDDMDYHGTITSVRQHFQYFIYTIMCIITYTSTSLSLNNNSNIDSQPLKIPPEEDCKVEICRGLTKDNTDKMQPFFLLSLQIYHTHSPATMIINTRYNMPCDVIYTHPDALICHNKKGDGGPITYQIIILYCKVDTVLTWPVYREIRRNYGAFSDFAPIIES